MQPHRNQVLPALVFTVVVVDLLCFCGVNFVLEESAAPLRREFILRVYHHGDSQ